MPLVFVTYTLKCFGVNRHRMCSLFLTGSAKWIRVFVYTRVHCACECEREWQCERQCQQLGNLGEVWTGVLEI